MAEIADGDGAKTADPADVIASQVDEHGMLSQLLGVCQKVGRELVILLHRLAARARAGDRAGFDSLARESNEHFWRGANQNRAGLADEKTDKATD